MGSSPDVDYFPNRDGAVESAPISHAELLKKMCPKYMAMGMTYSDYWDGEAGMCKAFREAYRMERQKANEDAWLNGYYMYNALISASPLFRDLLKDHKPEKYLEKPIPFFDVDTMSKEEKSRQERERDRDVQTNIRSMINRFNSAKKKKKEVANG